jgi:hypothetical protein
VRVLLPIPVPKVIPDTAKEGPPDAGRVDLAPDPPQSFRPGLRHPLRRQFPWGVELLDGRRCQRLEHYDFVNNSLGFKGGIIGYGCDRRGPALVGHLHMTEALWTFDTAGRVRHGYIREGTAAVRAAWYEY